jgi:hypothetical protein
MLGFLSINSHFCGRHDFRRGILLVVVGGTKISREKLQF